MMQHVLNEEITTPELKYFLLSLIWAVLISSRSLQ